MDYDFEPFLERLQTNWYEDDETLRTLLAHYREDPDSESEARLHRWAERTSGFLRELAEESALVDNRPRLHHYDAYGRRVDEIVLPASTQEALKEVEGGERLGSMSGDPFEHYVKIYLYAQNGEAGVACSLACTDGLVRALEALGDGPEHRRVVENVRGSTPERFYHGAQFVTEIQGGSDVPANETRAIADAGAYRLHGRKWFCSNVNADYFLVTGRPEGRRSEQRPISLFLVPAYREDDEVVRNGYSIDRLKDKLGTRELATAEVTFEGALAFPVGPLERGLANLLAYVLTPSRFHCVLAAAAYLRRAERIVEAYAEFRTAFGRKLCDYPLVETSVAGIRRARRRSLAASLELLRLWERTDAVDEDSASPARLDFRIMLSLSKPVLTRRCTELMHEAMMLLGGNGIEERFGPLPRLYRDSVINETWEGPHNVLLTQALRDLLRHEVEPGGFIERIAGPEREDLAAELTGLLGSAGKVDVTVAFARLAPSLVTAFADRALRQAGISG